MAWSISLTLERYYSGITREGSQREVLERRIAVINDAGREIGTVPVYSKPSYKTPAKQNR
jgi:hypothetical protein